MSQGEDSLGLRMRARDAVGVREMAEGVRDEATGPGEVAARRGDRETAHVDRSPGIADGLPHALGTEKLTEGPRPVVRAPADLGLLPGRLDPLEPLPQIGRRPAGPLQVQPPAAFAQLHLAAGGRLAPGFIDGYF